MPRQSFRVAVGVALIIGFALPAHAGEKEPKKTLEIPHCIHSLGTAAVRVAPEAKNWWSGQNLASPETVVKAIVQQSGCFTLVDRGVAMALADEERTRATAGNLRRGSNIGRGQVRAADYIIVPTLMSQNAHAGGTGLGGLLAFVPGIGSIASAVAGGLNISKKTANVHLEIVDVRSSEVVASTDGFAKKKDFSWGGGGAGLGSSAFAAAGATGYTDTEIGQVIMTAYVDAYVKLVALRGGITASLPVVAGSTSPMVQELPAAQESVTTTRASMLRASASTSGAVVRSLPVGTILYPTGQKSGAWLEVADEVGTHGWVSSLSAGGH